MYPNDPEIRDFLAAALRNKTEPWPANWDRPADIDAVGRAVVFHGIAGLLVEQAPALRDWPSRLNDRLRDQARAQAMWELRHRQLLIALLQEFKSQDVPYLLMKGTALAYDLYDNPANRSRGDTDLLVAAGAVRQAEAVLARLGYVPGLLGGVTPEFALQQAWTLSLPDGGSHTIDLHWQVMNAPSLKHLLPFNECHANSRALPRLSPNDRTMDRVRLLIHTCLHRAIQANAPYFVDGAAFRDPDRLIWSFDIHLIARSFSRADWAALCSLANNMGVSRQCLEGLRAAQTSLATDIPRDALARLEEEASKDRISPYFVRSPALARAWRDLRAVPGVATRLRYILSRVTTTEGFLRAKYPELAQRPLPLLYGRRVIDLIRRPSDAS